MDIRVLLVVSYNSKYSPHKESMSMKFCRIFWALAFRDDINMLHDPKYPVP